MFRLIKVNFFFLLVFKMNNTADNHDVLMYWCTCHTTGAIGKRNLPLKTTWNAEGYRPFCFLLNCNIIKPHTSPKVFFSVTLIECLSTDIRPFCLAYSTLNRHRVYTIICWTALTIVMLKHFFGTSCTYQTLYFAKVKY